MNSSRTKKPVIVITGAGKGIGRAIVLEFIHQVDSNFNPNLVLVSRTKKDLDSLAKIARQKKLNAKPFCLDISDILKTKKFVEFCIKEFGRVDCLIHSAGVGVFKEFGNFTVQDFDIVFNTNAKGTFFLTQEVFKHMVSQKQGDIIFITSTAAQKPYKESAIYCMSKFAQKGLIEVLRLYGRKYNIRITNVMPGAVFTPMWGELGKKIKSKMMQPQDIAKAVVDLYRHPRRTSVEEIVLRPIWGDIQDSP